MFYIDITHNTYKYTDRRGSGSCKIFYLPIFKFLNWITGFRVEPLQEQGQESM